MKNTLLGAPISTVSCILYTADRSEYFCSTLQFHTVGWSWQNLAGKGIFCDGMHGAAVALHNAGDLKAWAGRGVCQDLASEV